MYYIMFVLRFVLFFTNSKNDCMEGGGASVCVVAVRIEDFFRNSTIDESQITNGGSIFV